MWLVAILLDMAGIEHAHQYGKFYWTTLIQRLKVLRVILWEGCLRAGKKKVKKTNQDRSIASKVDEECFGQGDDRADREEGTSKKIKRQDDQSTWVDWCHLIRKREE